VSAAHIKQIEASAHRNLVALLGTGLAGAVLAAMGTFKKSG
jgi:hypothetical protein